MQDIDLENWRVSDGWKKEESERVTFCKYKHLPHGFKLTEEQSRKYNLDMIRCVFPNGVSEDFKTRLGIANKK